MNRINSEITMKDLSASPVLIIACGVFRSDLEAILSESDGNPGEGIRPDVEYLPGGLHTEPDRLRLELQNRIDRFSGRYQRIILLYGLCGRGIVGIRSGLSTLVLPRVHDCISLFLGGAEEYRKQFSHSPGTYYISAGWYEEQIQPKGRNPFAGAAGEKTVRYPEQYVDSADPEILEERYGRDNADEIGEFLQSWKKNYTRAVYIDTGDANERKYEAHARDLADENQWEFVRLKGDRKLIRRCLDARESDPDILIIPPGHEIIQDMASGTASSAPPGESLALGRNETWVIQGIDADGNGSEAGRLRSIGLGIDAGGTYTDAVIYDFRNKRVLAKAKSLTTKWKYSVGIMNAVRSLPAEYAGRIDLVSVSTTLVTNAIVESAHRPVGLLLMPNGMEAPAGLKHSPLKVISGRMSIGGEIRSGINEEEIRSAVLEMRERFHVEAFAVSGYGGSVNPELELAVKQVIKDETGTEVCCGHELSGSLNFSVRAATAVLNAGVTPIMEDFLAEMEESVAEIGIKAPLMVVRGDGSVMSESYAREYPVQTALSGPAASMSGARFLTGLEEALVIDVGGTTSDIGFLEDGRVSICDKGARIGTWDTHIKAVDMLTAGLGGDSEIVFERQEWMLGPRRIAPVCSLSGISDSLEAAFRRLEDWKESTLPLQFLYRTGKKPAFEPTQREHLILEALADGPLMIHELRDRIGAGSWRLVKSGRLESTYCVQRAGLTPTDLYHAEGNLKLWNAGTAASYLSLIADSSGLEAADLKALLHEMISTSLAESLLEKMLGNESAQGGSFSRILHHGNRYLDISPRITIPVVGLGAPAALMCDGAVKRLGGTLTVPEDGDVANAVGAIAGEVRVSRRAKIVATSTGGYRINGIEGEDRHYESLDEAEARCLRALLDDTRSHGRKAGTTVSDVTMTVRSEVARSAEGSELFIARYYEAMLSGVPDLI